ncbi:hypothetical protein K7G98_00735 [Saccharothrix sp. MB29]|nr:hypothetical protein [Saccharothrix sp. MB29]
MTNAGLGFFQQAHWAMWTLDMADPTRLERVAVLFFAATASCWATTPGRSYDDRTGQFIPAHELVGRLRLRRARPARHDAGRRAVRRARDPHRTPAAADGSRS